MKKFIFYSYLIAISFFSLNAISAELLSNTPTATAKVGTQPAAIFPNPNQDYGTLNVFCIGKDFDWNGNLDEDDIAMSWWKIKNVAEANPNNTTPDELKAEKVIEWESFGRFPARTYSSEFDNEFPIIFDNYILLYEIESAKLIDTIKVANVNAVSAAGKYRYLSIRIYGNPENPYSPTENQVLIYNTETKEVEDTIKTQATNVQQTLPYFNEQTNENLLAVLCEGEQNKGSAVEFYNLSTKELKKSIELGNTGNFLLFSMLEYKLGGNNTIKLPLLTVVINGEHKVQVIDANTLSTDIPIFALAGIPTEYPIPTEGYNGPRELATNSKAEFYVTAYDGKIYKFSPVKTGAQATEIVVANEGVPESITAPENPDNATKVEFAFTNIYKGVGTYTPNDEVVVVYQNDGSINSTQETASLFPNPIKNKAIVNIPTSLGETINVEVLDLLGNKIQIIENVNVSNNSFELDINENLSTGYYVLNLIGKTNNITLKFIKK